MIDEFSRDRTGWARFSDDRKMRYRLRRVVTTAGLEIHNGVVLGLRIVVWLMLNPSIADAFILDPTVKRCVKFTQLWGGDVCEVVNLHAYRSTDPKALRTLVKGARGDDAINDAEILAACVPAWRVVAGWGEGGRLDDRDREVSDLLRGRGVELEHLGRAQDGAGAPFHPLARGKNFIPYDRQPKVLT